MYAAPATIEWLRTSTSRRNSTRRRQSAKDSPVRASFQSGRAGRASKLRKSASPITRRWLFDIQARILVATRRCFTNTESRYPRRARTDERLAVRDTFAAMRDVFGVAKVCLGVASLLVMGLGFSACAGANYPDRPDVVKAQQRWCDALAKSAGSDASWDRMSDCKGASLAASPGYISLMTKCYSEQYEQAKNAKDASADDRSLLISGCRDNVLIELPATSRGMDELINAKCERAVRCEKGVTTDACKKTMDNIEPAQLAMFTTVYNGAALHEVARCLSGGCEQNEEDAVSKCYEDVNERLLWTP